MLDLCCTLVRFDLSNAHKNCAAHAFICFAWLPNGRNYSQYYLPLLPPCGCFTTIELEPHHLLCAKCCMWYQNVAIKIVWWFFLVLNIGATRTHTLRGRYDPISITWTLTKLIAVMVTGAVVVTMIVLSLLLLPIQML